MFDLLVFIVALSLVGIGVALYDPPAAMIVVGAIVLCTVFASRVKGTPNK